MRLLLVGLVTHERLLLVVGRGIELGLLVVTAAWLLNRIVPFSSRLGVGRLALTRLAKHKFPELLSLDLAINFISQLANMLAQHRLLSELLGVVLLDTLDLSLVRHFRVVDHRLHIVLQLLHNVLILKLSDVHLFALNVRIEKGTLFSRVAILEPLVPAKPLELEVKIKDEERLGEINVCITAIIARFQIHR